MSELGPADSVIEVQKKTLSVFVLLFVASLLVGILWLSASPAYANDETQAVPKATHNIYLSMSYKEVTPTPTATPTKTAIPPTGSTYNAIPVSPYSAPDRVDSQHADLNLDLRGYALTYSYLGLVDYNGHTDTDTPRLATMLNPARRPAFTQVYQVYDWNWASPPDPGTRSGPLTIWPVTLLTLQVPEGELVYMPSRGPDIYQGRYHGMVLYATNNQITIAYTRDGTVANGYTVHITNIWVDPALVALYQQSNAAGRRDLPGLSNGQPIGRALAGGISVAIRDHGTFMDPRSRKDWWPGW